METVTQGTQEPKTFTQEEVDTIIGERLMRERNKYADYGDLKEKAELYDKYVEENKTELQKANEKAQTLEKELGELKQAAAVRDIRERVSAETGVPVKLLTASSDEECRAQAEAIKAFAKPAYPNVRDGGEPIGQQKTTTASQFADWFNSQF